MNSARPQSSGALERAGVDAKEVDEVIMGQILTAGQGRTRRARRRWPPVSRRKPGLGLNQLCGSGLRAVALGMQQIIRRRRHHRGRRSGIDVDGAACHASARRREDGRRKMVDTMM
jgi:acetyl-CoA C-acetyltransferase